MAMAAEPVSVWDERQAYKELLYWDSLIQRGHRLLPHDFDRYEELRYWYDCLCYEEELRQYHEYITAIQEIEENRSQAEAPPARTAPRHVFVSDDRHVMAKHAAVYPSPEELEAVQTVISHVECALKAVSDLLDAEAGVGAVTPPPVGGAEESVACPTPERVLRGVMRVGLVAKGLLLKGDMDLELVLLCTDKPTATLLKKVADSLSTQIEVVTKDKYEVTPCPEEADIVIRSKKEPVLTLIIHLTSPMVRQEVDDAAADATTPPDGPPGGMNPRNRQARAGTTRHLTLPRLCSAGPGVVGRPDRKTRCVAMVTTPDSVEQGITTDLSDLYPSIVPQRCALLNVNLPWPALQPQSTTPVVFNPHRRGPPRIEFWCSPELAHLIS